MKTRQTKRTNKALAPTISVVREQSPYPDPHHLLMEAEEEMANSDLRQYADVISTLRSKGFSFREIAQWLTKRGVPTDHNGVYRVFTTALHPIEVEDVEDQARQEHGL